MTSRRADETALARLLLLSLMAAAAVDGLYVQLPAPHGQPLCLVYEARGVARQLAGAAWTDDTVAVTYRPRVALPRSCDVEAFVLNPSDRTVAHSNVAAQAGQSPLLRRFLFAALQEGSYRVCLMARCTDPAAYGFSIEGTDDGASTPRRPPMLDLHMTGSSGDAGDAIFDDFGDDSSDVSNVAVALSMRVADALAEATYLEARQHRAKATSDSTRSRTMWLIAVNVAFSVAIAVAQSLMLRRAFTLRKLV
jgi:hypothetical protein